MMARQCTPSSERSTVGAAGAVLALEIQPAREDARGRGLADAAHAGQHPGVRDAPGREGVAAACAPSAPGRSGRRSSPGGICGRAPDSRKLGVGHGLAGLASRGGKSREMKREAGRATRAESRWGCFLPDLTRLASEHVRRQPPCNLYRRDVPPAQASWETGCGTSHRASRAFRCRASVDRKRRCRRERGHVETHVARMRSRSQRRCS